MPLTLFGANMLCGLRAALADYEIFIAFQMDWARLVNGELLATAEAAGFFAIITGDRSLGYQWNLSGRKLAIIVLSTNQLANSP